jgi:hypothetical protein
MLPILKAVITGEASDTQTVRAGVEALLDDVAATMRAAQPDQVEEMTEDELTAEIRVRAVDQMIQNGMTLPVRELRRTLRGGHTPDIFATVIRQGNTRLVISEMDEDQYLLFQRQMGRHMDERAVELPLDPRQRQVEAARVPELRRLLRMLEANNA